MRRSHSRSSGSLKALQNLQKKIEIKRILDDNLLNLSGEYQIKAGPGPAKGGKQKVMKNFHRTMTMD